MNRILLLSVGSQDIALNAEDVVEVMDNPLLNMVPHIQKPCIGAINLHNQIIPLIDLCQLFNVDGEVSLKHVIVLRTQPDFLAAAASSFGGLKKIDPDTLQTADKEQCGQSLADRQISCGGEIVPVLSLKNLQKYFQRGA